MDHKMTKQFIVPLYDEDAEPTLDVHKQPETAVFFYSDGSPIPLTSFITEDDLPEIPDVLNSPLTGLEVSSDPSDIAATDTLLEALAKLQYQIHNVV